MPTFAYVARNRGGKKQSGTLSAETKAQATQVLQRRGLTVQEVKVQTVRRDAVSPRTKVKSTDLLVFTRQLSTIVSAGLPLLQGLDILSEQTEDVRFGNVIRALGTEVEAGETFSEALRRFPRIFQDLFISMVRAGEAGGDLDGVLLQLADYIEKTEDLKRRIKSAMMYPVIAFSMIVLIATGLIVFVVPQFGEIFGSFGAELPMPTQILIDISAVLRSWRAFVVVAVVVAAVFAIRMWGRTKNGRFSLDAAKLRLPVFGKLLRKVAVSRFTRTLSTLTRSGVPILQALEIVERTAGNEVFARAISEAGNSVRNGESLADPLERSGQFPGMVTRMIGVGEKTGALETMLLKISDFYDSEVEAAVDGLTSMIEPILIMMMGIIVGGIVVALFMPILQLSSLVQ
ncbi:MAG TPA: type II secretion system F family protein [Candidatus Hydrogenedentes bacterium]|nr:type II secretion system F family protein [Candidatus Hydrogenedentota bacterium]HPG69532.1 type II secretion system F family protein [Candidatus Hydrogenedentota bacterium]